MVCLPGGFGTLDEALEVLTLLQTGKRDMIPCILLDAPGGTYWSTLDTFIKDELLKGGMISEQDLSLYTVTDNCQEAVDEVLNYFLVYHSMRYVGDQLVLRIQQRLSDEKIAALNEAFSDILKSGEIVQRHAFDQEQTEPDLAELPRLAMHFDRRSHGRLRELINAINTG